MSRWHTAGDYTIRAVNGTVNAIVLTAMGVLLALVGYVLLDAGQVAHAADPATYAQYNPAAGGGGGFPQLRNANPDVIGWLTIPGTHIDYPLVQGKDDLEYLHKDPEGNYALSGSLFLGAEYAPDFTDFASITYGHSMRDGTMFGDLGKFGDRAFFADHAEGALAIGSEEHRLEIFAFLSVDAYDRSVFHPSLPDPASRQDYLNHLADLAANVRTTVPLTPSDHIILLSTCEFSFTNARAIVAARILETP